MSYRNRVEIKELANDNIIDLCNVCVPIEKRQEPDWKKGIEEKRLWALDMLQKWGSFAKIGYINNIPAEMIQFRCF